MKKPNFLYIGPPKAGSTWLYEALRHHPEVFLTRAKELHYFDKYYSLGPAWYLKHFREATELHRVIGEISHDYLYSRAACSRIAADLNKVQLMVCLREPVDRAYSDYLYMVKQGYVRSSFAEATQGIPNILEHGLYAKYLRPYSEQFGKATFLFMRYNDLRLNPVAYYHSLCQKLEINETIPSEFPTGRVLAAAVPRSWILARIAKSGAMIMREYGMAETITRIKSQKWLQRILYRRYESNDSLTIDASLRASLKQYYTYDVHELDREFVPGIAALWGYD